MYGHKTITKKQQQQWQNRSQNDHLYFSIVSSFQQFREFL